MRSMPYIAFNMRYTPAGDRKGADSGHQVIGLATKLTAGWLWTVQRVHCLRRQ
jgi:hypothetical protein